MKGIARFVGVFGIMGLFFFLGDLLYDEATGKGRLLGFTWLFCSVLMIGVGSFGDDKK